MQQEGQRLHRDDHSTTCGQFVPRSQHQPVPRIRPFLCAKKRKRNLRENKILSFKKLLFLMYLFLFGYVGFSLLHGVSSNCGEWRLVSRCVQVSHCSGFSCLRSRALGFVGFSSCGSWALEQGSIVVTVGLSCSMACGIFLDQMEPMSPALAGGLFTTEPPREPRIKHYLAENT